MRKANFNLAQFDQNKREYGRNQKEIQDENTIIIKIINTLTIVKMIVINSLSIIISGKEKVSI